MRRDFLRQRIYTEGAVSFLIAAVRDSSNFTIVNTALRRTKHVEFWILGSRRKAGNLICILVEQYPDVDLGQWRIKFMNARKDESTNVEGFSFVLELNQKSSKVHRDIRHMVLYFFLNRLKFNHVRRRQSIISILKTKDNDGLRLAFSVRFPIMELSTEERREPPYDSLHSLRGHRVNSIYQ